MPTFNDEGPGPQASSDPKPEEASLDPIASVYAKLDAEEEQEKLVAPGQSTFAEADQTLLRERDREYKDPEKHWVRTSGWLEIARRIAKETQETHTRGLRYLTLPAYYRLDVSLFLREGLLDVMEEDSNGEPLKVYVAAFENDPWKFGRMKSHKPDFALFGLSNVEEALTIPGNKYYHQLLDLFPFDLINLDLTTSLTPTHEGPYSRTLEAISAVFQNQASYGTRWGLFLTFRNLPSEWEPGAVDQLSVNLEDNLRTYPKVMDAFHKRYGKSAVQELMGLDPKECMSQLVVKWLVDRAHHFGFTLERLRVYRYCRYPPKVPHYDIFKLVLVFSRGEVMRAKIPTKDSPRQPWMEDDLAKCITRYKSIDVEAALLEQDDRKLGFIDGMRAEIDGLSRMVI